MSNTYAGCNHCGTVNRITELTPSTEPVCGNCKAKLGYHSGVTELSGAALKNITKESPIPVLVDFWAPWCGPCRGFAPTFMKVAGDYFGRIVFAKLNTDENQPTAHEYGIRGIPTLIAFNGGAELGRQSGALTENQFRLLVDEVFKRAEEYRSK